MTFAEALRNAMTVAGYRPSQLARELGYAPTTVDNWLSRGTLPEITRLAAVADFLAAPHLVQIVMRATSRRCRRCHRRFSASPRIAYKALYCSGACKRAVARAQKSRRGISARRVRTAKLERAIAEHCRGCEPLGLCRDAGCALRPVSPLPLIAWRVA